MQVLRQADYRRMPWKNGGGETTEVTVSPPGAGFVGRTKRSAARMASITAGPAQRAMRSVTGVKPARISSRHSTTAMMKLTTWLRVMAEVMQASDR